MRRAGAVCARRIQMTFRDFESRVGGIRNGDSWPGSSKRDRFPRENQVRMGGHGPAQLAHEIMAQGRWKTAGMVETYKRGKEAGR